MVDDLNSLPAELEAKVGEILKDQPADKINAVRRVVVQATKHHSGPLPDPETLAEYDKVIKDGAERLMRIVEKEQERKHSSNPV